MFRRQPSDRLVGAVLGIAVIIFTGGVVGMYIGNPLTSEEPVEVVEITDAPEPFNITQSGEVTMFTVEHVGNDSIRLSNLAIYIGPEDSDTEFSDRTTWSLRTGDLTYRAHLNGTWIEESDAERFEPGETLVIKKVSGTAAESGSFTMQVRVVDLESETTIGEDVVTIE